MPRSEYEGYESSVPLDLVVDAGGQGAAASSSSLPLPGGVDQKLQDTITLMRSQIASLETRMEQVEILLSVKLTPLPPGPPAGEPPAVMSLAAPRLPAVAAPAGPPLSDVVPRAD